MFDAPVGFNTLSGLDRDTGDNSEEIIHQLDWAWTLLIVEKTRHRRNRSKRCFMKKVLDYKIF